MATIGPLIASQDLIPGLNSGEKLLFLLIGPIAVPVGNILLGILSDLFGRRINGQFWRVNGRIISDVWWNVKKYLKPKQETLPHCW